MNDKKNCMCEPHSGVCHCNERKAESVKDFCGLCNLAWTYSVLCVKWCAYMMWLAWLVACVCSSVMNLDFKGAYVTSFLLGLTLLISNGSNRPPTNHEEMTRVKHVYTGPTGTNRLRRAAEDMRYNSHAAEERRRNSPIYKRSHKW